MAALPAVAATPVKFSGADLHRTLETFVGDRSPYTASKHHRATRELIGTTFRANGWEVEEQTGEVSHETVHNVIARRRGSEHPERVWVMGAHYDTVEDSPGADDNGVALAGVLEAARLLAKQQFRDTVELVAWDLEESGLMGSLFQAREARKQHAQIQGALVLEMIGCRKTAPDTQQFPGPMQLLFPDLIRWVEARQRRGDFIAVVDRGPSALTAALRSAAERTGLPLVAIPVSGMATMVGDFYRSDHASFWAQDYPAVMITDTANFRNPHYHARTDTAATLDFGFAASVMDTAVAALLELAGAH